MIVKNKPLIAHIIYRLDVGGLENGLVNIINQMPHDQFDHVIICLTDFTDFRKRIEPDVEVYALNKKPGQDFGLYWRLFKLLRKLKPDIVHTRNISALETQVFAWLSGVKYRIHGLHGWDVSDLRGENKTYQRLHRIINPLIHRYIPLSNDLERYLLEAIKVAPDKINKICNGVDTEVFYPSEMSDRSLLPEMFRGKTIIGAVGRLEVVKDHMNLVDAFVELLSLTPELRNNLGLVLIGDGSQRSKLVERLEQEGIEDVVWLAGNRDDVPQLLKEMDLFVLPSKAEGISNTVLEAMASGLPAVATNVGGNSQLIVEGETGKIVPKEDSRALTEALYSYVSQPELIKEQSKVARQRVVDCFSLNKMVNEYQKVYQKAQ